MEEKQEITNLENKKEISLRTQEGFIETANTFLRNNGQIVVPPNYDVNDAVKNLYLKVLETKDKNKRPVLEVCTAESIKQCIQNYVANGLNISKNQCYLIPYGNVLTLSIGSFGKQKQARSMANIRINSNVIYAGEDVKIEIRQDGSKIIHHTPDFTKFDLDKIVGAYAVAVDISSGEVINSDIMTKKEIDRSHAKSSGGTVHKEFPVEMCKKTVISRLAKVFINTSDDEYKMTTISTDVGDITINADEELNKNEQEDIVIIDEKDLGSNEQEQNLEPINENSPTSEISYAEFKNNPNKYRLVPNSYNKVTKTVMVYE